MAEEELDNEWREWKKAELTRLDARLKELETSRQQAKESERYAYIPAVLLFWWPVMIIAAILIWHSWKAFFIALALGPFFALVFWLGESETEKSIRADIDSVRQQRRLLDQKTAPSRLNIRPTYEAYLASPDWKERRVKPATALAIAASCAITRGRSKSTIELMLASSTRSRRISSCSAAASIRYSTNTDALVGSTAGTVERTIRALGELVAPTL